MEEKWGNDEGEHGEEQRNDEKSNDNRKGHKMSMLKCKHTIYKYGSIFLQSTLSTKINHEVRWCCSFEFKINKQKSEIMKFLLARTSMFIEI